MIRVRADSFTIADVCGKSTLSCTLEQFAAECHRLLAVDAGPEGRERVRALLGEVCRDKAFVATYLSDDVSIRQVLYEDAELGFCIVGHVEHDSRQSRPHDHGPTWAIYGQAAGETVMTDWVIVSPPAERRSTGQGAACARLHADAGQRPCLQRGRRPFAAARWPDAIAAHRRLQSRIHTLRLFGSDLGHVLVNRDSWPN